MGKPSIRTVTVNRRTTVLLLILATILIATLTLWISGKSYEKVDPVPFREIRVIAERLQAGPVPMNVFVALVMPAVLNALLFIPWGFLMFLALDRPERPTHQSYLLALLFGLAFSFSVEAAQYFLPTRVTDINDVIWNGAGVMVGAIFGHLRKRVRIAFE
jgi:glycopeptide antibiotics resistance protein